MKTEERHRLQEHELRKLTLKAGEFWNQHGMKVVAVLAGVAVIVVAAVIWMAAANEGAAEGWAKLTQSTTAEQLTAIAEDYSGEPVGHWARLRAAELHLQEGVRQAFSNRGAAVDELEEAVEQFATLLSADLPSDKLRERALYGHARALEALAAVVEPTEGKVNATLDDAIAAYEKLLKTYPETLFKPIVEAQIKALQAERTRQFVAWFREQRPQPSDRALPRDGLPAGLEGALQPPATSPFTSPGGGDPLGPQLPGSGTASPFDPPGSDTGEAPTTAPSTPEPPSQDAPASQPSPAESPADSAPASPSEAPAGTPPTTAPAESSPESAEADSGEPAPDQPAPEQP